MSAVVPFINQNLPIDLTADTNGKPRAGSRDVAAKFGKRHDNVLRDIDALISQGAPLLSFEESSYRAGNGKDERCINMDRDGFTLLAMGFTGADALKWKLAYIAAFNAMEDQIKHAAFSPLSLPNARQLALLVIAAEDRADAERAGRLEAQAKVEVMAPAVAALERISEADGSLCITDGAKTLKVKPKLLTAWLKANGWVYSRGGSTTLIGKQDKINSGLLEHKCTTILKKDGDEKVCSQVRITSNGMAKLGSVFAEPAQNTLDV